MEEVSRAVIGMGLPLVALFLAARLLGDPGQGRPASRGAPRRAHRPRRPPAVRGPAVSTRGSH